MGFTIGKQQTDDSNAQTALTHTASNIGAIDGNVIINAGGTYQQTGSSIVAGMGADSSEDINNTLDNSSRGNTVIRAQDINIDNVMDVYTNQSEQKFKQSGLTVSLSNSLIDSAKSIDNLIDAGGNTGSTRMKGMAGVAAGLKTRSLAKEATSAAKGLAGGINANSLKGAGNSRIQATIGSQKSQSNSSSYTEVNQGSNINTNNLALIATGAGSDSNININGSSLTVSNDALFQADNDFNVNGVAQNSNTRSNNKSSSAAIGGYASTGSGVGITASASKSKGYANSDSVTYANSNINVGNTTTLDIGNDVNIKGGVINTDKIQGAIGGDMTIESLQDTYTYDSDQKNAGFTLDVALEGAGSSLSVNGGKTNLNADYQAVGAQSGIFANEADLVTEGKGNFIGGVFTTSADAQANGKSNIVFKQGVTSQDINNTTSYDGDAFSAGVSIGDITDKPQANMNGLGYGTDSDSDSSITKGGVSGYNDPEGILTTENREALGGKLDDVFDANRVNKELGAQTQITQEFGKEAPKAVAEFAEKKMEAYETAQKAVNMLREDLEATKDPEKIVYISDQLQLAEQQLNESETDYQNWKEGGKYRVATHALLLGGLGTGSVEGVLTTGGVAAAAPTITNLEAKMRDNLIAQGMDADTASNTTKGITSLALAGAGVAVGLDTSSTVTAVNVDANNRQLHPEEAALIKQLAQDYAQKNDISITEAEKRLTRGALYNIDVGWQSSIKNYIDAQEIQTYQQAYKYLTNQTRDISVSDLSNQISLSNQPITEVSDPTLPNVTLDEIVVNASKESVSGSEGQREDYYLDTVANGFTATKEDFKNEELFLVNAFSNTETKNLLEDRAAIKQSEVGFIEGIARDAKGAKGTIVGASTGVYKGAKETLETVVDSAKKTGEIVEGLINNPKKTISGGVNKAQSLIVNAPEIAKEGFNQLEDASALSNAKLNLYDMQQDAEAKAKYKANIAGQIAGGGGVGSIGKNVVKKGGNIIDNVANEIGKGLDGMSPKPATVVGTPDTGGATTITGKPDGTKNGIGAAETGGAILSTGGGDADKLYDNIRADSTDIDLIAKNTGLKPENIEKVKNHVFYDEHLLDKYVDYGIPAEKRRFDSSLEQSQAWERLKTGSYTEDDITWLKHETAERWYENKNSAGYTESHDAAEKKWTGNPWEINK